MRAEGFAAGTDVFSDRQSSADDELAGAPSGQQQSEAAGAPRRARRNFLTWYLSCLCPPDTAGAAAQEAADLRRAVCEEHAGMHGNDSTVPLTAADATTPRPNWLMRVLLHEHYTDGTLIALKTDIFAGITLAVAQVAPSVAFAIMGHGDPLVGLFSSFFLGFIACVFGGRPGQITAIAGAVVVLYPDLVDEHGYGAACAVSIIAGCFILLPGVFRVAKLVRLLPSSLMVGFCNGLALSMVINQIPQFKDETGQFVTGKRAFNTAAICVVSYAIMMLLPYFTTIVPSAFVAIFVGTAMEYIFRMNTVTIGHLYQLHGTFPTPRVPQMDWSNSKAISDVMVASILTAVISCIESFMAGYKMQQLTETPTNFERESLALGAAHIVNGFFNGMAGCVVYGPCILNLECGAGTRRLSALICAILMVVIPLALYMVIAIIPMGALSAVLFGVSSKTADWRMLAMMFLQRISFQESVVAILVTVVTVIQDLAIGAAAGFAAALVFFMWNMSRGRVSMVPVKNSAPYSTGGGAPHRPAAAADTRHPPRRRRRRGGGRRELDDDSQACDSVALTGGSQLPKKAAGSTAEASVLGTCEAAMAHPPAQPARRRRFPSVSSLSSSSTSASASSSRSSSVPHSTVAADGVNLRVAGDDDAAAGRRRHRRQRRRQSYSCDDAAPPAGTFPVSPDSSSDEGVFLHRSIARNPTSMDVNFLDVRRDREFPEVKVLRIKVSGVLFFGSCMEFVDGMIRLLHEHHGEIFLKVTDIVLDFQHGLMPVMDFSAAEAIEDVARIFSKRGIRTHVQNMDPLSWTCFERCRRYFQLVSEDNVNNVKNVCYARRIFKVRTHLTPVADRAGAEGQGGGEGAAGDADAAAAPSGDRHRLDEDVFVRINRSFTATVPHKTPTQAGDGRGVEERGTRDAESDVFSDPEGTRRPSLLATPVPVPAEQQSGSAAAEAQSGHDHSGGDNGLVPPSQEGGDDYGDAVGVVMTATEERVSFVESVKVGFPIYRPQFGITVVVFDTVAGWARRTQAMIDAGRTPALEVGLDQSKPLNRQFCEFGRVWWDRLRNRDVPKPAGARDTPRHGRRSSSSAPPRGAHPVERGMPTTFQQVPRFPGQGYAKGEHFSRTEWAKIRASVATTIFNAEPPQEVNAVFARWGKFQSDLLDGFI